jgi:Icc protein
MPVIRRISIIALIILLLTAAIPSFAWKFASLADSRGSSNGVNTTELTKIIGHINSEGVDLVLFQGDAVNGSTTSDSTTGSQMDTWVSTMNQLKAPWYYCPGNHEINTSGVQNNVLRAKVNMPTNGPSSDPEMVYSFDHQNAHFVALNSNHYGQVHHLQRDWMAADLAKTTQPHVFVMEHEPAYPVGEHKGSALDVYASERDDYWNKMTAGRVSMVFNGHEHLYSRTKHGSIYQVINGSCGAALATGYANTIGKYNYVIVDINGNSVSCTAHDDNGAVMDSWSYSVPSSSNPQLSLTLTSNKSTAAPSDTVTYTITYKNNGAGAASNDVISLPVPANTTFVAGSAGSGIYNSTSNAVTWTIASIATGASGTCTMQVKVN